VVTAATAATLELVLAATAATELQALAVIQ
jgi:hypothetical protein